MTRDPEELAEQEAAHAETISFLDQHERDFPDCDVSALRAALERRIATKRRVIEHPDAPSHSVN